MKAIDLKSNIHKIVDEIQNTQLLQTIYDFLKVRESTNSGQFWNSMTEDQKQEVLQAFEDSENEENLISRKRFFEGEK